MSNQSWLKKFEQWTPKNEADKHYNRGIENSKCKGFSAGVNGLCKHYMGCPVFITRTCAEECDFKK